LPVYTDDSDFAATLFPVDRQGRRPHAPLSDADPSVRPLVKTLLGPSARLHAEPLEHSGWRHLVVSGFAEGSQYQRVIDLLRSGAGVPDRVACVARAGRGFQGFRGRSWMGSAGNVHLTVHLAPNRAIERFESVFLALAAVSVLDAIDAVPGLTGRASVKWVNDVTLDGGKVAGVLAYTQTRGATVTSVVLGIGVNVEVTPAVVPTAFVPAATSLREHTGSADEPGADRGPELGASMPRVLRGVLNAIATNYEALLEHGYRPLVDRYRARSAVLGREVLLSSDEADEVPRVFASGRVVGIGDGLELRLEGHSDPIDRGRLILGARLPAPPLQGPGRPGRNPFGLAVAGRMPALHPLAP